jgi:nitrate/nitrite transport system substrate-binding protein
MEQQDAEHSLSGMAASPDDPARRDFMRQSGALTASAIMSLVSPAMREVAWAAGSDAPEKPEVRIGFIPLTDCASVVMASELGFDRKYGLKITPAREASWAAVRDKLVAGDLDAAHVLYGLMYGVQLGIGGTPRDMAVLMTLNANGQGISTARSLTAHGVVDGPSLAQLVKRREREFVFAQTYPTGTHAMWLYYWLAANGINPLRDVTMIVIPPPQMVANMRAGNIDGCCVGEPWNARAVYDEVGFTVATSQEVWRDHPEKVLGTTREFVERYPNTARAMIMAVLDASRWIDASADNRRRMAETIAAPRYVDVPVELILDRILGHYQNGLGRTWTDPAPMKFYAEGAVNFPYLSDGMWFLTQFKRWGLLTEHPDYAGVAAAVNRIDLYREAAGAVGVALPAEPMRSVRLMDGAAWSGQDPLRFAQAHDIRA